MGFEILNPPAVRLSLKSTTAPRRYLGTEWVDQNRDALHFIEQIVGSLLIEGHGILHPGASTLLDVNTEGFARVLRLLQQRVDLLRRALSNLYSLADRYAYIHIKSA